MSATKSNEPAVIVSASCGGSASLVEQLKDSAAKLYERAKCERQNLVRLAPQYRKNDKYNAEGEYMQNIKLAMGMRRAALGIAKRLESESSPNIIDKSQQHT
jgi:hypothetical protein